MPTAKAFAKPALHLHQPGDDGDLLHRESCWCVLDDKDQVILDPRRPAYWLRGAGQ